MYPVLAKRLTKAYYEASVSLIIRINFDAKRSGIGQRERVSGEFLWERVAVSETILDERAIVDFECGVAMWRVLISEIDLAQFPYGRGSR